MRIAYVYDMPLPTTGADSEQVVNTVAALSRRGVDVELVVPPSTDGEDPTADSLREYYQVQGPFSVTVVRGPYPSSRAVAKPVHAWMATRNRQWQQADVVYTRNLPTLAAALAAGHRVVYEHFRPWGDQYPPMQVVLRKLMRHPRFVGGIFHSRHAERSFARLGVPPQRLHVAHNGFSPERMRPRLDRDEARDRVGLRPGMPTVVYTGRINDKKGLGLVLHLARRLPEAQFALVGSEGQGPVEQAAAEIGNVTIFSWQRFDALAPFLYAADVLLVPPSTAPLQQHGNTVLPLKLFSYLAAGRAIFAPRAPDTAELLRDGENAVLVPPGDLEAATAALDGLIRDPRRRASLAEAAAVTAEGLTWDARAERIETFLAEWLESTQPESSGPHTDPWTWRQWVRETLRWGTRRGLGRSE